MGIGMWIDINIITTRELQTLLKKALNKIEPQNFENKIGIVNYDKTQIALFRRQCKNIKLRHIFFRLISKDFFTKEKMFRFGMCNDNQCTRCGETETFKHLLWECPESARIWNSVNAYMSHIGYTDCIINNLKISLLFPTME